MPPKSKSPKISPNLTPVLVRAAADSSFFASAQTLWDELCRFKEVLLTDLRLDRTSPRYTATLGAVKKLADLLKCQESQTRPIIPLSDAPKRKRK